MTQQTTRNTTPAVCDRQANVTRSLLGYGVIAGPVYVTVALNQALTREGFDLARHPWSMLANGDLGWIQITNFVVTALMTLACAVGLRRALRPGIGAVWAPRLVAAFGVSMIGAGIFRADPAMGFPAGTPEGPGVVSWHGTLHFVSGAIGFLCVIVACFVVGRRLAAEGRRGWAVYSRITGALFLVSFAAVASGGGAAWANLAFVAGIVIIWAWLSALSVHLYRRVTSRPTT
ncbi:DUF998 domain-containing protein [Sphaerisporangium corydalis]|uniref:DUF998 domain-containing protein n=1 Tax=Sphaerisporangium corydalis TaxID=1441875 RepID=A0ABV9EK17_9ACTN|nr:DUF998 domain-containing protein [Sphaerisporangium corydalis]